MQTTFHFHHAVLSPRMQARAERGIARVVRRLGNDVVRATARFEEDGPIRRVEIALHAWRGKRYLAEGSARYFGPALAEALARIAAQIDHGKRTPKARAKVMARA